MNIPGIRWLEREKADTMLGGRVSFMGPQGDRLGKHLSTKDKTLFELIPDSLSINSMINKGANKQIHYKKLFLSRVTNNWTHFDDYGAKTLEKAVTKDFSFIFANFMGIDKYSHTTGCTSKETLNTYISLDEIVGRIGNILENRKILKHTLLIISSDHGHSMVNEHFDLNSFCNKYFNAASFPFPLKRGFDCFVTEQGNKAGFIYLKRDSSSWKERCDHTQIESKKNLNNFFRDLINRKEIGLVITRDHDKDIILSNSYGVGRLRRKGKLFSYEFDKNDPLNLELEGEFSLQSGLDFTIDSNFIDVFLQVSQIFEADRTGDLVVLTKENYDLREGITKKFWKSFEWPLHKSGHGGLSQLQLTCPIAINQPLNIEYTRNLEIFQLILQLLGIYKGKTKSTPLRPVETVIVPSVSVES